MIHFAWAKLAPTSKYIAPFLFSVVTAFFCPVPQDDKMVKDAERLAEPVFEAVRAGAFLDAQIEAQRAEIRLKLIELEAETARRKRK